MRTVKADCILSAALLCGILSKLGKWALIRNAGYQTGPAFFVGAGCLTVDYCRPPAGKGQIPFAMIFVFATKLLGLPPDQVRG